jgi:DNA-binding NarL/FixJ family response regulator
MVCYSSLTASEMSVTGDAMATSQPAKPGTMSNNSGKPNARLFVVDDHPIVRGGLVELINKEPGLEVCGEASNAQDAMQMVAKVKPSLVIVDVSLDGTNGIELIKNLSARHPSLPILAFSMHDEVIYAERALRAGAKGYIMKQEPAEKLMTAIQRALKGQIALSENMSSRLLGQFVGAPTQVQNVSPVDRLSDRELEVLQLMGKGLSTTQIADQLFLSVKTIETYREHLKQKLKLNSGQELLRYAIEWSLNQA